MVFPKGGDVAMDRFANICDRFFARLSLRNTAGQAGALDHPVTILAAIQNDAPQCTPHLGDILALGLFPDNGFPVRSAFRGSTSPGIRRRFFSRLLFLQICI